MTIGTVNRADATGNGAVDTYPFTFKVFDATHLRVTVRDSVGTETQLTLTAHYTVQGVGRSAGGTVTLVAGAFDWLDGDGDLKDGYTITIRRVVPLTQAANYRNQDASFLRQNVEDSLDKGVMISQQQQDEINRTLRAPETEGDFVGTLPSREARASRFLAFNSDGDMIATEGSTGDSVLREELADSAFGSDLVALNDGLAPAYVKTLSDIANGDEVSLLRFVNRTWHAGIRAFTYANDVSANLREAAAALSDLGGSADSGGRLYIPYGGYAASDYETDAAGNYVVNVRRRVHIRGEGKHATKFSFNPDATASVFRFKHDAEICYQSSLRGVSFIGDGSEQKTAIEAYDTSELTLEDFSTYPWTGANSRGVWMRGREITRIDDYSISADQPIHISVNPNHSIGCDHLTIGNGTLHTQVTTNHAILIDSGVHVTNLLGRGQMSVNLGAGILKWVDTGSAVVHANVKLQNIRCEQSTVGTSYLIDIQPNLGIQNLEISNIYGGLGINGVRLRKFTNARLIGTEYIDTEKVGLDAIGTNVGSSLALVGCLWQQGATASLVNLQQRWAIRPTSASQNIPSNAVYHYFSDTKRDAIEINGVAFQSYEGSIAQAATVILHLGAAAGIKCAILNIAANGASKQACGVVSSSVIGGAALLSSVGDLAVGAVLSAGKLTVVNDGSSVLLVNDTGESLRYLVDARFVE